ncbi:carbohydrate ABC transporter permease [Nocardioides sp. cx-173]|uniref:carbohydrate ABC transporter permease n=1 Tax=Nocardioides sp. cx-173 TaxID=2898796 RepID=UPI001E48C3F7|nr:sugar ABC transporter permease [Nocardioides sp. cx-173]MCD4524990.1 sugar ABC transporter permease [Nocardioides sp. cx-173]UGB40302.1 sugar ABC transporter permease [Nocardioides sp. cx-173]
MTTIEATRTGDAGKQTGTPPPRLTRRQRLSRWDFHFSPYLYVVPFFLVFLLIGVYPMVYSGYLSFFSWPRFGPTHGEGVGWANYVHVLQDPVFHKAFWNTIGIFVLSSGPQVVIATVIAAMLDTHLRGRTWWRMSVLLPFVVAPAATALIFGSLFADKTGLVNEIIQGLGLPKVGWHTDRFASWTAIASMVNYRWTGYNTLIILAALQAVPRQLYEAASIDGASRVRQFFHVTLPSISPTMVFVIITSTIGGLQIFTEPRLFDTNLQFQGGADYQYQTLTMYVFNTANSATDPYPRAAAATWIIVLIIVVIALLNFGVTRLVQRRSER